VTHVGRRVGWRDFFQSWSVPVHAVTGFNAGCPTQARAVELGLACIESGPQLEPVLIQRVEQGA
jgi:hypothetical protein